MSEVRPGDDLARLLADALAGGGGPGLVDGDVLVVTQKVVSKAEGRVVPFDEADPGAKARLVEEESVRVLRRRGDLVISETAHGFVCANAGVDLSNVAEGTAALLPLDPDRSARRLRATLRRHLGVEAAVIVSDTFGRPWRQGVTDVAIGCAGIAGVIDLRGRSTPKGASWSPPRCAWPTRWRPPPSSSWARIGASPPPSYGGCRRTGCATARWPTRSYAGRAKTSFASPERSELRWAGDG